MSGHKRATVTARAENIRELSQTEMAIRFVEAGMNELSQRLDLTAEKERDYERLQNETKEQELIQALSEIDEVFGHLEQGTRDALIQQEDAFYQQLWQYGEYVEQHNAYQIAEINSQYQTALDDLAEQHELTLNTISEKVESVLQDQQALDLSIHQWVEATSTLLQSFAQHPGGNSPRNIAYYTQLLDQALENQQAGYKEAALISAQNAYREISRACLHRHQLQNQFSALSRLLRKKLTLFDQEIELNKQVHVMDLQGTPLDMEIWVDDWVGGKLSQMQEEIRAVSAFLDKPASQARLKRIHQILAQSLPQWRSAMNDYVFQARSEVINSQLRMNIALMVVRALADQGDRLETSSYADDDMRSEYRAQLTDHEGSRVMVQVEPQGELPEALELNLFTQDADKRTPHELRQRSMEIQRSLRKAGLNVGELTPVQSIHPSRNRNHRKPRYLVKQDAAVQVNNER